MLIRAIAATLSEDTQGHPFTESQLEALAKPCTNPIILYNFDESNPIGRFDKVEVIDKQLVVEAELVGEMYQNEEMVKMHKLVPGYTVAPGKNPEYKIMCYGLTLTPADKTLPEIEILS